MTRILIIIFCLSLEMLNAQSPYLLPDTKSNEIADRLDILYDFDQPFHLSNRNISRVGLVKMGYAILNTGSYVNDHEDILYILSDNNEYLSTR